MDSRRVIPLAREDGLLVEQVDSETVVYDTYTMQAHCLGPIAAAIFASADGHTSLELLAAHAQDATGETVRLDDVEAALDQLSEARLLDEPDDDRRSSRRQVIRRGATFGAALAGAALVTSIHTPVAAAAVSCALGKPCSSDTECKPPGFQQPSHGGCNDSGYSCHCAGLDDSTFCAGQATVGCTANNSPGVNNCCGVCAINSPMGCRCTKNTTGSTCVNNTAIISDDCGSVLC
jgi:hypothetical protein